MSSPTKSIAELAYYFGDTPLASSDEPQKHEVTRVLDEMTRIAREQIDGEPVVDYDGELATLYISDPYFAYWLRWGTHVTADGQE